MSKHISKFSGSEVDAYISKIINGEVVLENTINKVEENKQNPVTSDTLYNIFKEINDNFKSVNKNIDVFKKQIEEIIKGDIGLLNDLIGVDDNGDVFIKPDGDNPRNFYTRGTISFGGSTDNDTEPTIIANLSDLLDVSLKDITNGQSLVYENGYWVNKEIKTGLTDEEINNMLNPINTKITNLENKVNPLEARIAFFENIIGVDKTTGDVYIKKNGDLPRNFYTHGTISFGGLSINEDVSVVNKISDLSDVFINNISANQILVWDTNVLNNSGSYGAWVNKDLEQGLNTEELSIYLKNNEYVQKTYVDDRITDLINGAPAAYDTLKEIADVLSSNVNSIGDIMLTLSKKADKGTTLADYGITDALDNTTKYALADSVGGNALNALKLGGQGPLYYATAVGLTEVSNRVKTLEDVIGIDKNGDVYIKDNNGNPRNFYTYGTISFNGLDVGSGEYPSTGNITISVNGVEYTSINGYVELPSYPTSFDWANVENKPNFATVATSGKYSDLLGVPTSLPASDVYDWAKAATKPSYTFNEITGKPTTLGEYGITDALSTSGGMITGKLVICGLGYKSDASTVKITDTAFFQIGAIEKDNDALYIGQNSLSTIWLQNAYGGADGLPSHNFTYPICLQPIGGNVGVGVMSPQYKFDVDGTARFANKGSSDVPLVLESSINTAWISFITGSTKQYFGASADNRLLFQYNANLYDILHSGNYSNYALPLSGGIMKGNIDISNHRIILGYSVIEMGQGMLGAFTESAPTTLYWYDTIDWREIINDGNIGSYNAGSATKLQTARNIWGQSFDGTQNVSGKLSNVTAISFDTDCGVYQGSTFSGSMSKYDIAYYGTNHYFHNFSSGYNLIIKENGNVLIGTTDDAGYKLYVYGGGVRIEGSVVTGGEVYADGWFRSNGNSGWYNQVFGGGIWMTDYDYVRVYNGKGFQVDGTVIIGVQSDYGGKIQVSGGAKFYIGVQNNHTDTADLAGDKTFSILYSEDNRFGLNLWLNDNGSVTFQPSYFNSGTDATYNLNLCPLGGNVGVGTSLPYSKFEVAGNIAEPNATNVASSAMLSVNKHEDDGVFIGFGATTKGWIQSAYYGRENVTSTAYAYRLWLNPLGGDVYIGNGNHRLYVSGNLTATGTLVFGSDIRYKDIIENTTIGLETIANAPLFNYKWNDRDDKKIHLGTSAQYWYETAFKNAVVPTTDEKLWTMGYAEIALGNTITLAKELIPIKKEVNKIKVLEERVKKLENILIANNIIFD